MRNELLFLALFLLLGCTQYEDTSTTIPEHPLPASEVPGEIVEEHSAPLETQEISELNISTPAPAPLEEQEDSETASGAHDSGQEREIWSPLFTNMQECEEKEVQFTVSPIPTEAITAVEPQGELTDYSSGHIIPGDHIGLQYDPSGPALEVRAMADGYLVRVEKQPNPRGFGVTRDVDNYHLYFEYSCSVFGSYVHVTELAPEVAAADEELNALVLREVEQTTSLWPRIPVKAGQVIGKAEGFGLLGMLTVDTDIVLSGFLNQSFYNQEEPWKIHAVPPFEYFTGPIRSQLLAKNPRQKEPRGGKIDFDMDGRLVGNWFLEGTGYNGDAQRAYCGDYLCPYWNGHLAFVYDFVDPDQIRISIGYDSAIPTRGPYGVKDNTPDPRTISPDSGPVLYPLVSLENRDADFGLVTYGKPLVTESSDEVVGVLLVEMLDNRTIRMEVFPGAISGEPRFTNKAGIYRR